MTTSLLPNFFAGRWQTGTGAGTPLFDPVLGTELARVSNAGIDLAEGFAFAREKGGAALRAIARSTAASREIGFASATGAATVSVSAM